MKLAAFSRGRASDRGQSRCRSTSVFSLCFWPFRDPDTVLRNANPAGEPYVPIEPAFADAARSATVAQAGRLANRQAAEAQNR